MDLHVHDPADLDAVRRAALPLSGGASELDALISMIGEAEVVMIGEATHGTHEFYRMRSDITRRLVAEKRFSAVAIEGDWPDAYRADAYVRNRREEPDAAAALAGFRRFPNWMWRNTDVADFLAWLRRYNMRVPEERRAGFYGLDLYSLSSSMAAVLAYFDRHDPHAAARARERYACFDRFGEDSQVYGLMVGHGAARSCEAEVLAMLVETRRKTLAAARRSDEAGAAEAAFDAAQNALLVKNAEAYYRSMFTGGESSWNLRDGHMAQTLWSLRDHLARNGPAKVVVWAHNSHVGDARATEMGRTRGQLTLGQLARQRLGRAVVLIGFSTYQGTVVAASSWDAPGVLQPLRSARDDSIERLMHDTALARFVLPLRDTTPALARALSRDRLTRAVGVIYRPDAERESHYFHANVLGQFDALLHIDVTRGVQPLDAVAGSTGSEAPETYPSGT